MAYDIPTSEPTAARAGDTWQWTRTLADWPASVWTLSYTLINAAAKITLTATADGDTHDIDVPPATTAAYTAGRYDWTAQVTDGTNKYPVGSGAMDVLPDITAASTHDSRSHARVMLDAIEALLENRATTGDLDVIRASYGNLATERDIHVLRGLHAQYAAAVEAEDNALAAARGERRGFVQMRF